MKMLVTASWLSSGEITDFVAATGFDRQYPTAAALFAFGGTITGATKGALRVFPHSTHELSTTTSFLRRVSHQMTNCLNLTK